jgi:hypothetical protein
MIIVLVMVNRIVQTSPPPLFMKKPNYYMILQWIIFFPILFPLVVVFGAMEGTRKAVENMARQIQLDFWNERAEEV